MDADDYGYMLFNDTVLDKQHSFAIERVQRQYSGNAKQVIEGISVVSCVYVRLHQLTLQTGQSLYQLKQGLLDDYLVQQLRNPSIKMAPA